MNPRARHVTVHTADGVTRVFRDGDILTGDFLPEFSCPVEAFFV